MWQSPHSFYRDACPLVLSIIFFFLFIFLTNESMALTHASSSSSIFLSGLRMMTMMTTMTMAMTAMVEAGGSLTSAAPPFHVTRAP